MPELPGGGEPGKPGKKKDKTQMWILIGTFTLVALGYLALKSSKGGGLGGSAATPTATGAESGGNTASDQLSQSQFNQLSGQIAELTGRLKNLPTTVVGGGPGGNASTPAVHPETPGGKTPVPILHNITTKPIRAGKRAGPVEPHPGAKSGSSKTYTVKQGDTLSGIAKQFGTTWQALYAANQKTVSGEAKSHGSFNAKDPGHWIYSGEKLTVPGKPGADHAAHPASKAGGSTHDSPKVVAKAHPPVKG